VVNLLIEGFPQNPGYLTGLEKILSENVGPVAALNLTSPAFSPLAIPTIAVTPAIVTAEKAVVKVISYGCSDPVSGSGVVIGSNLVLTAGHVVAGAMSIEVESPTSYTTYAATPVYFDPEMDIAILQTTNLPVQPIALDGSPVARGDPALEVGYPQGGNQTSAPGVVRAEFLAEGTDLYGTNQVLRTVVLISGTTLPGDSGGALLTPSGSVLGMTFASGLDDASTGYALTPHEIQTAISGSGRHQVSTGECLSQ
jgi:S1-C subfamily serine protease